MDTERGKNDTARASSDEGECYSCVRQATHVCRNGWPVCPEHTCPECVERPRAPGATCSGCAHLRDLLRLALGKLRDVQRADLAGTINSLEIALDEARPCRACGRTFCAFLEQMQPRPATCPPCAGRSMRPVTPTPGSSAPRCGVVDHDEEWRLP